MMTTIDYIVQDIQQSGTPASDEMIIKLLGMVSPIRLLDKKSSEILIIEAFAEQSMILETIARPESTYDSIIEFEGSVTSVKDLVDSGKASPAYAVSLAVMPIAAMRWYVLQHISKSGGTVVWPNYSDDLAKYLESSFSSKHLWTSVEGYLGAPIGDEWRIWVYLFGLSSNVSIRESNRTRREFIEDILSLLSGGDAWENTLYVPKNISDAINKALRRLGVGHLLHWREAAEITKQYDAVVSAASALVESHADIDLLMEEVRKELTEKLQ